MQWYFKNHVMKAAFFTLIYSFADHESDNLQTMSSHSYFWFNAQTDKRVGVLSKAESEDMPTSPKPPNALYSTGNKRTKPTLYCHLEHTRVSAH